MLLLIKQLQVTVLSADLTGFVIGFFRLMTGVGCFVGVRNNNQLTCYKSH